MTVSILLSIKIGGRKLIIERESPPITHHRHCQHLLFFADWPPPPLSILGPTMSVIRHGYNIQGAGQLLKDGPEGKEPNGGVKHCLRVIKDKKKEKSFYF
jgi:hypothetical protein